MSWATNGSALPAAVSRDVIFLFYPALERSHLECQVQERHGKVEVQQRDTRMIKGLEHVLYEETLTEHGLFIQEKRRHRGDFIDVYKYLTGGVNMTDPDSSQWCPMTDKGQWAQTEI